MFLSVEEPEQIVEVLEKYPNFRPMYEQVYEMCRSTERVMGMFSRELKELDDKEKARAEEAEARAEEAETRAIEERTGAEEERTRARKAEEEKERALQEAEKEKERALQEAEELRRKYEELLKQG